MRGAADAPAKIRAALHSPGGNSSTEALVDIAVEGVMQDAGNVDLSNAETARAAIENAVDRVLVAGGRPVALGGDHAVTFPIVRAMRRHHPQLSILHIDAHPDLYDEFEGDRCSHACPFARIMEEGLADRLVQLGIRTMNDHQRRQAQRFGVEVIDMRAWYVGARPSLDGSIYLSIDLDGIDPAFTPGVSHPEPGGLTVREVIAIVQNIAGRLVGADIVECNPTVDPSGLTARVGAKLVKEVVARMHGDR